MKNLILRNPTIQNKTICVVVIFFHMFILLCIKTLFSMQKMWIIIRTSPPQTIKFPSKIKKNVARFDDIYDKLKLWCPITITHHKVHLNFMTSLEIIWRWICYYNRTTMRDQNILARTFSWPCHCILCHYSI